MRKYRYLIATLILIIIGLALVALDQNIGNTFWNHIIDDIAAAIFISGIVNLISDFILRKEMLDIIIRKVNLKKSIDNAGIEEITFNWRDIPYSNLMLNTKSNVDIVHAYANTWTRTYEDDLVSVLRDSDAKIRVILLDINSDTTMTAFANQYKIEKEELIDRINSALRTWKRIYDRSRIDDPDRLILYAHSGIQTLAIYKFDNKIVSTQLRITKNPSSSFKFPSIICSNTDSVKDHLYQVYSQEIEDLILESRQIDLNSITS